MQTTREFKFPLSSLEITGKSAALIAEDVMAVVEYDGCGWFVDYFEVACWDRAGKRNTYNELYPTDPLEKLIIAAAKREIAKMAVKANIEMAWLDQLMSERDVDADTAAEYRSAA